MSIVGIFHPVVSVSAMDRSLAFYRDALGLTVTFDDYHDPAAISALFGIDAPRVRSVVVQCPDALRDRARRVRATAWQAAIGASPQRCRDPGDQPAGHRDRVAGRPRPGRRVRGAVGDRRPDAPRWWGHPRRGHDRRRGGDGHPGRAAGGTRLAGRLSRSLGEVSVRSLHGHIVSETHRLYRCLAIHGRPVACSRGDRATGSRPVRPRGHGRIDCLLSASGRGSNRPQAQHRTASLVP